MGRLFHHLNHLALLGTLFFAARAVPIEEKAPDSGNNWTLNKQLFSAVRRGNVVEVNRLLKDDGADVNAVDLESDIKTTPLHLAAWQAHHDLITALIVHGANVNAKDTHNRTALHWAIAHTSGASISALIHAGADTSLRSSLNWTPLHMALLANNTEAVIALVEGGADVNAKGGPFEVPPLFVAVSFSPRSVVAVLLKNGVDVNAIVRPVPSVKGTASSLSHIHIRGMPSNAWHTKTALILTLLQSDEQVSNIKADDVDHYTPLRDRKEIVKMLLESGKALAQRGNMRPHSINASETGANTPLLLAVRLGRTDIVETLLNAGALVQVRDANDWTPLHWAAYTDNDALLAQLLLDAGADVNAKDIADRWTPLHLAVLENNYKVAKTLVQAGAEVKDADAMGWTPVRLAEEGEQRKELREYFSHRQINRV